MMKPVAPRQYPKPPEGTWTEHYPELGTAPVSYESSISPEFFELEREAIFKRAWLNVGRVEQLRRNGSYFTKELAVACREAGIGFFPYYSTCDWHHPDFPRSSRVPGVGPSAPSGGRLSAGGGGRDEEDERDAVEGHVPCDGGDHPSADEQPAEDVPDRQDDGELQ